MHLKALTVDQEQEIRQQEAVIVHLKLQFDLEYRYVSDTRPRAFLTFLKTRPSTSLIKKILADQGVPKSGDHWLYETHIRFNYRGSNEEILEFKDLWKLMLLETSRDDF